MPPNAAADKCQIDALQSRNTVQFRADLGCSLLFAAGVFLSRYLTRGALYFVDGPRMIHAIQDHTYVIQPPGYWLYCRLGSMFGDPAFGLTFFNELFSAAGASVFFLLSRRLRLGVAISLFATLAYSSIFFVWFAGDIQSSYASQILFAPLTVYCFLLYRDRPSLVRLIACSASFAVGAGLRPSDGAFLGLLFIFLAFQFVPQWKRRGLCFIFAALVCLAWYLPTEMALRASHGVHLGNQLDSLASQVSPLLTGINQRSVANIVRVVLPLLAAFWMLIPAIPLRRPHLENWTIALWTVPGLSFFLLVYMADATYLTFLAGAVVLLAATAQRRRIAAASLLLCCVFNVVLFLGAQPVKSTGKLALAANFYVVKYCNYGIRHQWSSTIGGR